MRGRQGLAVHGDSDERLAVGFGEPGGRETGGPAVERAPDDLRRARLHSGHVEHIPQSSATPQGVPYQVPTHLI